MEPLTYGEFARVAGFAFCQRPRVSWLLVGTWARGQHGGEGAVTWVLGVEGPLLPNCLEPSRPQQSEGLGSPPPAMSPW